MTQTVEKPAGSPPATWGEVKERGSWAQAQAGARYWGDVAPGGDAADEPQTHEEG